MTSFNDFVGVPKQAEEPDELDEELPVNMSCFTCGSDEVKTVVKDGNIRGECPKGHVSILPWSFDV